MPDYKALFQLAKAAGATERKTSTFHEWNEPGDQLVGIYVDSYSTQGTQFEGEFRIYTFDCGEGLVKFTLGAATDREIAPQLTAGQCYAITFQGMEKLPNGRNMKRYEVEGVPLDFAEETGAPAQEDGGRRRR